MMTPKAKARKLSRNSSLIEFLAVLEYLSNGQAKESLNDSSGINLDMALALNQEGLISGHAAKTNSGIQIADAKLTPDGALAMLKWTEEIEKHSTAGKLLRVLWIIGGVLLTRASDLLFESFRIWANS